MEQQKRAFSQTPRAKQKSQVQQVWVEGTAPGAVCAQRVRLVQRALPCLPLSPRPLSSLRGKGLPDSGTGETIVKREYRVTWEIDIEADSSAEAVQEALKRLRRPRHPAEFKVHPWDGFQEESAGRVEQCDECEALIPILEGGSIINRHHHEECSLYDEKRN